MSHYGYALGMTTDDIETKARLLLGYIGFEPISDPRAVALLAAIPTASERSTVALRAMALGANGNGIQRALSEAFDQARPIDNGPDVTSAPTLKLPFYKSRKFWAIASTVVVVGAATTGIMLWRRRA